VQVLIFTGPDAGLLGLRNAIAHGFATLRDPEPAASKNFSAFFSRPPPRGRPFLCQILHSERRKSGPLSAGSGTAFPPPNERRGGALFCVAA
jgi:hypothetical protein